MEGALKRISLGWEPGRWARSTACVLGVAFLGPIRCGDGQSPSVPATQPHGSQSVAAGAEPAPEPEAGDWVKCAVVRVVDGDTIKVQFGENVEGVRYIGIDTPETVHPNRPVEPFGPEASAFNKALLSSGEVYLAFDVEKRDHFGRLLAYVYTIHENRRVFVNLELIRAGLAHARQYPPNVAYSQLLSRAEEQAREEHRGLWNQ